jgi:ATP-dependent RNA helicase SUPV3L1/SUV3
VLSEQAIEELGWSSDEADEVMRGLGFVPNGKRRADAPAAWRATTRRGPDRAPSKAPAHSPFAALAALKASPKRRRRPRKRVRANA